jgi:hypothetical protein
MNLWAGYAAWLAPLGKSCNGTRTVLIILCILAVVFSENRIQIPCADITHCYVGGKGDEFLEAFMAGAWFALASPHGQITY